MRYLLLDPMNMGGEPELFDTAEELVKQLEQTADDQDDDYYLNSWRKQLEIFEVGDKVDVDIQKTINVTLSKPTPPPSEPETLGDILAEALRPDRNVVSMNGRRY